MMASSIKVKIKSELQRLETPFQSKESVDKMHELVGYSATAVTKKQLPETFIDSDDGQS